MKKIILLLLLCTHAHLQSLAEIKIEKNSSLKGKEKKTCAAACKRASAFYNWYMTYLGKNEAGPVQHIVYDQYLTAHLRTKIMTGDLTTNLIFLGRQKADAAADLVLQPLESIDDKVYALLKVQGKDNNIMKIEMMVQRGNWCINNVTPQ